MKVVEQMLARYPVDERRHALREVMQEIALAGLQRAGFFEKAAFYGGTCLRIFHGLPRFSEDLDDGSAVYKKIKSIGKKIRPLQATHGI